MADTHLAGDLVIDEELYSRQLYVVGHDAMRRLLRARVLVVGLDGLGQEIAKNLCLAGVRVLGLYDPTPVSQRDLCASFFLSPPDIGSQRDSSVHAHIATLNRHVSVKVIPSALSLDSWESPSDWDLVISCNRPFSESLAFSDSIRSFSPKCRFALASVSGLFSQLFIDFRHHVILDRTGTPPATDTINDITQDGVLTLAEGSRHSFALNDMIRLRLNNRNSKATSCNRANGNGSSDSVAAGGERSCVKSSSTASKQGHEALPAAIGPDVYRVVPLSRNSLRLVGYSSDSIVVGGDYEEVRQSEEIAFSGLRDAAMACVSADNKKGCSLIHDDSPRSRALHRLFCSEVFSEAGVQKDTTVPEPDLVAEFERTKGCVIAPMCSVVGGIAAQEVLKGLTGQFVPLRQFFYFEEDSLFRNKDAGEGSGVCGSACGSNSAFSSVYSCALSASSVVSREISDTELKEAGCYGGCGDRYCDMVTVFGRNTFDLLATLRLFVVGAGAIGCEHMKNLVMSGIGSGSSGAIFITDNDSVEQSNLNRQFLFRSDDVGSMKAQAVVKRARTLNSDFSGSLTAYDSVVSKETEDLFSDTFYSQLDAVLNALDNVEARNYVDGRCVCLRRAMFDSGTLGTKGHVQSVIPFLTECYRSTVDAPEASVPLCTIKTFPTAIEHAIEWALEVFREKFAEEPERILQYLANNEEDESGLKKKPREFQEYEYQLISGESIGTNNDGSASKHQAENSGAENTMAPDSPLVDFPVAGQNRQPGEHDEEDMMATGDAHETVPESTLVEEAPRTVEDCIKAALDLFVNLFSTSIQKLLETFPVDYVTKEGLPFWAPPKRAPTPLSFNINDKLHVLFVETGANLFASAYGVRKITRTEVFKYLENVLSLKEPSPIKFENSGSTFCSLKDAVTMIEFEKDSWHADFLYACANLRARNYRIKEQGKHFIRGVAGKIVPAIATTTAVVSGLCVLELIRWVRSRRELATAQANSATVGQAEMEERQNDNDSRNEEDRIQPKEVAHEKSYWPRNAFIDLSAPFVALVESVKAPVMSVSAIPQSDYNSGGDGKCDQANLERTKKTRQYTLWSRLEFPDMKLRDLIREIGERVHTKISMISIGTRMVYWEGQSRYEENMEKTVAELCHRRPGQLIQYLDVLADDDSELEDIAVVFE